MWGARACWLLKPAALLQSPFKETAWIDLDCIIRGNIRPLIDASHCEAQFACVREVARSIALSKKEGALKKGWVGYNSGVFSFQKDSPIMNAWVELTMKQNHLHMGDSDTLNHVLNEGSYNFCELSDKFNRRPQDGIRSNTLIAHYVCNGGKAELMNLFKSYEEQIDEKVNTRLLDNLFICY